MEIDACGPQAAEHAVATAAADGLTTKELYRRIQAQISPRILLDKSPAYALDPAVLHKAERDFRAPLYIHLTRHPAAVADSFTRNRLSQVLHLKPHHLDTDQLAELVWTLSHQNIVRFLGDVPAHRHHTLRFEDLVTDPETAMRTLCSNLGLPFDAQVLRPYDDLESKMVDGVHPVSTPMGDPGFAAHGQIRDERARTRLGDLEGVPLGEVTWQLAAQLGYPKTPMSRAMEPPEHGRRQLLVRQRQPRQLARSRPSSE